MPEVERADPRLFHDYGLTALRWLLFSLAILFFAALLFFAQLRADVPPEGRVGPHLPAALWLSTGLLLAAGGACAAARRAALADRQRALTWALLLALALGFGYLGCQWAAWRAYTGGGLGGVTFYVLTALHWLHVGGGLVLLGVVTARAHRGAYWSLHHPGVSYATTYWHFLDATWLVILGMLWFVL
jgi:cytochrome c oxidase subunit 3